MEAAEIDPTDSIEPVSGRQDTRGSATHSAPVYLIQIGTSSDAGPIWLALRPFS